MRVSIIEYVELQKVSLEFRGGLPSAVIVNGTFVSDLKSESKHLGKTGDIRIPLMPAKNPMLVRVVNALFEELSAWTNRIIFQAGHK